MSELISIGRSLVMSDHQRLRQHIPEVNHTFSDVQLKWHRLGEAGLNLVGSHQYARACDMEQSNLARTNPRTLAETINTSIIPRMQTEKFAAMATVLRTDFVGEGPYRNVSIVLDGNALTEEYRRLTLFLDKINGKNVFWGDFTPHISLATIDEASMAPEILDVFDAFVPDTLKLESVKATTS